MKAKELIEQLQKNPEAEIRIAVQSYTQAYPAGYFVPWGVAYKAHDDTIRINVTLPKGFSIAERKNK